jgi:O-antigen/teichoic acid export membrane protein
MAGLTHSTLRGFFWMFLGTGAQAALQLLVLIVLTRLLSPKDFGMVEAASVVIGFTTIFSQLGVGPAVVQRAKLEEKHLRTAFTLSLLFGAALTALIWFFAPLISGFFRIEELAPVLRAMSFTFFLQSISVIAESLVQRNLQFRRLANVEILAFGLGFAGVGVTLAIQGFAVWALVGAYLSQALIKTIILLMIQPHPKMPLMERTAFRDLMVFGTGFTLARIGNYLAGQGDKLVVGRWLGPEALGLYGRSYQLMSVPASLFGQVVDRVLFPVMARIQEEPERLALAFRRGVALVAIVIMPVSGALFLLAPELVYLLLGPGWDEVVTPFQIFAGGMLFRTSYKISDSICRATGAVYRRAWRQAVFAILVMAGAYYGQCEGLKGVAVGVLSALFINFLLMAQLSLRLAGMTWTSFWIAHGPALALTLVLGAEVWGLAAAARNVGYPPVLILAISVSGMLLTIPLLLAGIPRVFLGHDGQWMMRKLTSYLPIRNQPTA